MKTLNDITLNDLIFGDLAIKINFDSDFEFNISFEKNSTGQNITDKISIHIDELEDFYRICHWFSIFYQKAIQLQLEFE